MGVSLPAVGFDGKIDEVQWAAINGGNGGRSSIADSGSFVMTSVTTAGQPTVQVAAGAMTVHGIYVSMGTSNNVSFSVPTTGTRWDTVVIRLNWADNTATLDRLEGTSTEDIASGVNQTVGNVWDIVLGIVQVTAGSSTVTTIRDRRVFSSKVYSTNSVANIQLPTENDIACVGRRLYRYEGTAWKPLFAWALYGMGPDTDVVGTSKELPMGTLNDSEGGFTAYSTGGASLPRSVLWQVNVWVHAKGPANSLRTVRVYLDNTIIAIEQWNSTISTSWEDRNIAVCVKTNSPGKKLRIEAISWSGASTTYGVISASVVQVN